MMNVLKYYKLDDTVVDPKYGSEKSACFDLCAWIKPNSNFECYTTSNKKITIRSDDNSSLIVKPDDRVLIPTGLIFQIPEGYSMRIYMRSSVPLKQGLVMPNSEGIIDEDFFHMTQLILMNVLPLNSITIKNGDRLCQGEIVPVIRNTFEQIFNAPTQSTDRVGGLGSTGNR